MKKLCKFFDSTKNRAKILLPIMLIWLIIIAIGIIFKPNHYAIYAIIASAIFFVTYVLIEICDSISFNQKIGNENKL